MKSALIRMLALAACVSGATLPAKGEAPGAFEGIEWIHNPAEGGFDLSWTGKPGRYYFIEQSPDLAPGSWTLFPYATKGHGGETGVFLNPSPDRYFFRLRYTDDTNHPLLLDDFNASGFSNRDELDIGANPFDATDTNGSGVPDHIEAFWADVVPESWKLLIVNDPNKAFYDTENSIAALSDVRPGDDYDGDGRSNLREYLDGTDPTDFFNGSPAYIRALAGDAQTATPETWIQDSLIISVANAAGAEIRGAPVRFVVHGGHNGLASDFWGADLYGSGMVRNSISGTRVDYKTPAMIGTSLITANLPNGESLTFTLYTVAADAKSRQGVTNFKAVDNGDGTTTYTWQAGPAEGDFFKLQTRQANGTWLVFYETSYGSPDLPLAPDQTDFSLTVTKE